MTITKSIAKTVLHDLGAIQGFRFKNRGAIRILMYHRFRNGAAGLGAQCEIIRHSYNPVSLRAISEHLRGGEPLPPNPVAITVDDGYRDFLEAHRVFWNYEIPTTMYLVSDFLDRKLWLWFDQLKYALQTTRQQSLTVQIAQNQPLSLSLMSEEDRLLARVKISEQLKNLENSQRIAICQEIRKLLRVEIPSHPPDEFAPLEWDEVRLLKSKGVEFGAHTKTHPILSRIKDPSVLHEEIQGSKHRLEVELGEPTIHFCYPNGRRMDINAETLTVVGDCGFQSAVTTERGMNSRKTEPFLLRRLGVEPSISLQYFAELLAGVRAE